MKKVMIMIVLAVLVAACTQGQTVVDEKIDLVSASQIASIEGIGATIDEQYFPHRSTYGVGLYHRGDVKYNFNINETFDKLPGIPADFARVKYRIESGKATGNEMCNLTASYFEQPEFYSDTYLTIGLKEYKNPDPNRWKPEGYRSYPSRLYGSTIAGEVFEVCSFLTAGYGVETYQGLSIQPVYPSTGNFQGRDVVINDSASRKYLTVKQSPDEVLLAPAYLFFEPGWAQKVSTVVTLAEDTPPGLYAVGFNVGAASVESNTRWSSMHKELYTTKGFIQTNAVPFILTVEVK